MRPFCLHPPPAAPAPRPGAAAAKGRCPCGKEGGTGGRGLRRGGTDICSRDRLCQGCRPRWQGRGSCSIVGIFVSPVPARPRRRCGNPPGCSSKARARNAAPHSLHGPGAKLRRAAPVQSSGGRFWCTVPGNGFDAKLQCPASVQGSGARSWCSAQKHSRGTRLRCPAPFTAPVPGLVPTHPPGGPGARRLSGKGSGSSGAAAPLGSASVSCARGIEFTSGVARGVWGAAGTPRGCTGSSGARSAPRGPGGGGSPGRNPAISKLDELGVDVSPPLTTPGARGAPGAPGPAPLPARRSAAGARGQRQLRVAAATGECQPGGGRRSHCFSLNFMASVHYYTVRIFIWTAKLKTDFCQNCRYHKKPEAPGARRSPRCGGGPAPRAGGCPGVGRDVGDREGCGVQEGGDIPVFVRWGTQDASPYGGAGGPGGPRSRGRGGPGWQRAPPPRGLQSRPLPRPVCQAPSQRS